MRINSKFIKCNNFNHTDLNSSKWTIKLLPNGAYTFTQIVNDPLLKLTEFNLNSSKC